LRLRRFRLLMPAMPAFGATHFSPGRLEGSRIHGVTRRAGGAGDNHPEKSPAVHSEREPGNRALPEPIERPPMVKAALKLAQFATKSGGNLRFVCAPPSQPAARPCYDGK